MQRITTEYPSQGGNPNAQTNNFITNPAELDIHSDSLAFSCLTPEVFAATVGIIPAVLRHLRWRPRTGRLLEYILFSQGGEDRPVSRSYAQVGAALFPNQNEKSQRTSAPKVLKGALENMQASGFDVFTVKLGGLTPEGRRRKAANQKLMKDDFISTEYFPGVFYPFFKEVQRRSVEADIFALEPDERGRKLYYIIQAVCHDFGYRPLPEAPEEKGKKAKAAKADEQPAETDIGTRVTKADIEARLVQIEDELITLGQQGLNMGIKLPILDAKMARVSTEARVRLKAAVQRKAGRDVAPDTGLRARGQIGLDMALEGLKMARGAAEELGWSNYVDFFDKAAESLSQAQAKAFRSAAAATA